MDKSLFYSEKFAKRIAVLFRLGFFIEDILDRRNINREPDNTTMVHETDIIAT